MVLTGSLWRVKHAYIDVFKQPRPYSPYDSNESQHVARPRLGEILLVGSEKVPREPRWPTELNELEMKQTFVKIVSPCVGFMNSTYFMKDSIWLERIA